MKYLSAACAVLLAPVLFAAVGEAPVETFDPAEGETFRGGIRAMDDTVDLYADFGGMANGASLVAGTDRPSIPADADPWRRSTQNGTNHVAETQSSTAFFGRGTGVRTPDTYLGYLGNSFKPTRGGSDVPLAKRKFTMAWDVTWRPSPSAVLDSKRAQVSISNASPGVVTWPGHGLRVGWPVTFSAFSGSLPSPLSFGTTYYVREVLSANTFTLMSSFTSTALGSTINTSGGSGQQTCTYAGAVLHNEFTIAVSPSPVLNPGGANGILLPKPMLHIRVTPGGVTDFGINTEPGAYFRSIQPVNTPAGDRTWLAGTVGGTLNEFGRYTLIMEAEGNEARLTMGNGRTLVFQDAGLANFTSLNPSTPGQNVGPVPGIGECLGGHWFAEFTGETSTNATTGVNAPYRQVVLLNRVWASERLNRTPGYGIANGSDAEVNGSRGIINGKLVVMGGKGAAVNGFSDPAALNVISGDIHASGARLTASPYTGNGTPLAAVLSIPNGGTLPVNSGAGDSETLRFTLNDQAHDKLGDESEWVIRGETSNSGNSVSMKVKIFGGGEIATGSFTASGKPWIMRLTRVSALASGNAGASELWMDFRCGSFSETGKATYNYSTGTTLGGGIYTTTPGAADIVVRSARAYIAPNGSKP